MAMHTRLMVVAPIALATLPVASWAQAPSAAATAPVTPTAAPSKSRQLEEIVVTSQKRRENVRSVPGSITVLSAAALQGRQIQTIEDVSRVSPGVSFQAGGGPGLDIIEVRGISSSSGSATVGIYLDEVPITLPNFYNGAIEPQFFDLSRVEVLRGPQGTLFGASSMGGTLRFISNVPDLEKFSGYSETIFSGTRHGSAYGEEQVVVNIPLIPDKLAVRLGADFVHNSGWINNYSSSGQLQNSGTNADSTAVFRASALYKPDDDWTITPSVFYQNQTVDDTSVYYPLIGLYKQDKEVFEPSRIRLIVGSLDVAKDLGFATLNSISGYFQQKFTRTSDGTYYNSEYLGELIDADPPFGIAGQGYKIGALPGPEYSVTTTGEFSQEVRLTSKTPQQSGLPFSWIGGLFLSSQTIQQPNDAYVNGLRKTFQQIYGIPIQDSAVFSGYTFPADSVDIATLHNQDRQYAVFGQASYLPLPHLTLTAGVRYTIAKEGATQYNTGYFAGSTPSQGYTALGDFYALTPKFSVSYDVSPQATLYATASKGFRVGGAAEYVPTNQCASDLASIGLASAPRTFGSDSLWNYEAGAKGRFFNGRLSFSTDAFLIDWRSIQQTLNLPTCGYVVTTNVGNAQSYGTETEARGQITDDLALRIAIGTVHATLTSVSTSIGPRVGEAILNSPDWSMTIGGEYRHQVSDRLDVFASVDNNWIGESHGSYTTTDPDYLRKEYNVVNATAGLDYGPYEFSLFAKNLLDNTQIIQRPSILFVEEGYTLRPLTVGGRFTVKF